MKPSYAHAHLIRALLLDGYVGDQAGAIAEFEEVLRLMPGSPAARRDRRGTGASESAAGVRNR